MTLRCWFLGHRPLDVMPTDRWVCAVCGNEIASFYKWRTSDVVSRPKAEEPQ